MSIPKINLAKVESVFAQLDLQGTPYGLGAKAEGSSYQGRRFNRRSTGRLSTPVNTIDNIDCSGLVRYLLYKGTDGKLIIPDGSQMQREWCEGHAAMGRLRRIARYADVNRYMTNKRLFVAFIKPFTNGCGSVGHVWLVSQYDGDKAADTMESHGGVGVNSRNWDYRTLFNQFHSCYELPTL